MPVVQCIVAQWRHISSESAVALLLHMCSISIKYDAKSMAWDILLVLTSVAGNLCNKCPSGYLNKTAVKVILSMGSLVSIKQQSPRRPCDIISDPQLEGYVPGCVPPIYRPTIAQIKTLSETLC